MVVVTTARCAKLTDTHEAKKRTAAEVARQLEEAKSLLQVAHNNKRQKEGGYYVSGHEVTKIHDGLAVRSGVMGDGKPLSICSFLITPK